MVSPPRTPGATAEEASGRVGFALILTATVAIAWALELRARQPVEPGSQIFVPTRFIVLVFGIFALTWVVYSQLVLDAFSRDKFGYLEWLTQATMLSIARGLWNVWTPYPQGTQVVIAGVHALASTLGALASSDIWSPYTLFRLGFELIFLLGPSVIAIWLIAKAGAPFGRSTTTIAALTLALSFGFVYYGAASAYVTDPLPAVFMLAGVAAVMSRRFTLAGVAIGIGAAFKLFPILLLPVFLVLLPHRAALRLCIVALAVVLLLLGPFALLNPAIFASPFNWQSTRPPWESWYAFVDWATGAPHEFTQPYFEDASVGSNYGWVFTGITPRVSVLQVPVPAGPPRWESTVSLVGTVIGLLLVLAARGPGVHRERSIIRWCLFALSIFFMFAIGWSPQYELYLIPLVLLAFDDPLVGAATALLLQAITFLDYPLLLPWAYFYGGGAVWLEWGAVLARYAVLAWLAVYVLRTEASLRDFVNRLAAFGTLALRRRAVLSHVSAIVLALGVLLVPAHASAQNVGCGPTRAPTPPPTVALGDLDWRIPGGWFFTEASQAPPQGYSMIDDGSANMWSEFSRLGGWQVLGFPASQRFVWHGQLSQATQRAVLQWSQVTGQVEFANVLDLMHDEGRDADLAAQKQIPPPLDVDEAGLPYETIAANRLAWLDARPAIKSAYCNAPGGSDPLQLWGLPTSKAVNMSPSGGEVYVLRTQRAAFQEWVDGSDFAAPGTVTVVLAGDLAKEFELLPAEAVMPQSAQP
jgi:hypothetical protein